MAAKVRPPLSSPEMAKKVPGDGHDAVAGGRAALAMFRRNERLGPPPSPSRDGLLLYTHPPAEDDCPGLPVCLSGAGGQQPALRIRA